MIDKRGVYELRNAIISQAAYDYEKAIRKLRRYPKVYQEWTDPLLHVYADKASYDELEKYFDAGFTIEFCTNYTYSMGAAERHGWWVNLWKLKPMVSMSAREIQGKFYRDINQVRSAQRMIRECEDFFRSEWYRQLCDIDGEWMIRKLREQSLEKRGNFFKNGNTKELQRRIQKEHDTYWDNLRTADMGIHKAHRGKRRKGE